MTKSPRVVVNLARKVSGAIWFIIPGCLSRSLAAAGAAGAGAAARAPIHGAGMDVGAMTIRATPSHFTVRMRPLLGKGAWDPNPIPYTSRQQDDSRPPVVLAASPDPDRLGGLRPREPSLRAAGAGIPG